jgi:Recombination endonuclease VII
MELFKRCPDCGQEKPVSEFGNNRLNRDGLQVYCKACCSRRGAEMYRRKRARLGKTVRTRVEVPPGHKYCRRCDTIKPLSEWHKNVRQSDGLTSYCKACRREIGRLGHLKRTFGLSPEDLAALIAAQGGTCAICDGPPQHIDHDHDSGKVRGVLCGPCNMGLGQFQDEAARLLRAAAYLRRHGMGCVRTIDEGSPIEGVILEYIRRHRSA